MTYEMPLQTTVDNQVDFNQNSFKLAVSFEGYRDKVFKNDIRYVKWIIRVAGKQDDVKYETILPHYKCTDTDFESFYPINPQQRITLEAIRSNP